MNRPLFVIACVPLLAAGCGKIAVSPGRAPVACTMEAKECPDGSYVSRGGPNCEFAACPEAVPQSSSTPSSPVIPPSLRSGGITGYIHSGPTCPVQKLPPDPNCADRPYANAAVTAIGPAGRQYHTQSDANGKFSVSIPAGVYTVVVNTSNALPQCQQQTAQVGTNTFVNVDISCDSGIR